jgi:serine/threonine protein kinase
MSPAKIIGSRYEIRDVVGRGGMGVVYRAFDRIVGREVALKTLGEIQGPVALDMFYKEWRLLASLHHPNIVDIFDIGDFDDGGAIKPFFVMPLLPGATLEQLLRLPGQAVSTERIVEIIAQTCRGLQALHESGLVHRDIKPSNIFVLESNSVKLIDFGLVHLVGGNTGTGIKGTVGYMSPEQVQGQECTAASDVFSLGVVCYEALTGLKPFQGRKVDEIFGAILTHIPPPISELNAGVNQMVSRAVHKALAKNPRHRYASALEFAETLQRAIRGETVPALDPGRIQPRIQRAIRAFEQGRYDMAMDILTDLEASGHMDPALTPLRNQIEQALRKHKIQDFLERAQLALAEDEFTLALQNVETVLTLTPANDEALKLRDTIRGEIVGREVDDHLANATSAIEQYSFARARQLLQRVFDTQPDNPRATSLLQTVESREQAYRAVRQEKDALYRAAREAWQNSEFATAASKLRSVLALESQAPDTSAPDSRANCSNFLNLAESAQATIESLTEHVARCLSDGRYEHAVALCIDVAAKYPGHTLPQGLRLQVEEIQKRDTLLRIRDIAEKVNAEPELERKLELLRESTEHFPNQPLLETWARAIRERVALVNAVAAKARVHEEHGRFDEAQEEWDNVRAMYPEYPGFEGETRRVAPSNAVPRSSETLQNEPSAAAASAIAESPAKILPAAHATQPMATPAVAPSHLATGIPQQTPDPVMGRVREWVAKQASTFRTYLAAKRDAMRPADDPDSHASSWKKRLRELVSQPGLMMTSPAIVTATVVILVVAAALLTSYFKSADSKAVGSTPLPARAAVTRVSLRCETPGAIIRLNDVSGAADGFDVDVAPGVYELEVNRDGYETLRHQVTIPAEGLQRRLPALRPLPSAIRLITDLQKASVRVDDGAATPLTEAEFSIEDLQPGDHVLTVSEGQNEARIMFRTANATAPAIIAPVQSRGLRTFAAGSSSSSVQVGLSGFSSSQVLLDNRAPDQVDQGLARFHAVGRGTHEVLLNSGTQDERRFSVEAASLPTLWVGVYSDRNVGTLIVSAGLMEFTVYLNGVAVQRRIRDGVMRIQNLSPKAYKVSVSAPGYDGVREQTVEVKKGSDANLPVSLVKTVLYAQLGLRGLPPKMQVILDGSPAGTTDASGVLTAEKIEPGEHAVELRHAADWKSVPAKRLFTARDTVTLGPTDFSLDRVPATATIKVAPENARVEWACHGGARQSGRGPQSITCPEGQLNAKASAPGYEEETRTMALTAGGKHMIEFSLKRIEATPAKASCGPGDLTAKGWKSEGGWFLSNKGASLPCGQLLGDYTFAIATPKGRAILGRRTVSWSAIGAGRAEFELDDKYLVIKGQARKNVEAFDRDGSLTLRLSIAPEQVVVSAYGKDEWHMLTAVPGDFRKARVEFGKDAKIGSLSFKER